MEKIFISRSFIFFIDFTSKEIKICNRIVIKCYLIFSSIFILFWTFAKNSIGFKKFSVICWIFIIIIQKKFQKAGTNSISGGGERGSQRMLLNLSEIEFTMWLQFWSLQEGRRGGSKNNKYSICSKMASLFFYNTKTDFVEIPTPSRLFIQKKKLWIVTFCYFF